MASTSASLGMNADAEPFQPSPPNSTKLRAEAPVFTPGGGPLPATEGAKFDLLPASAAVDDTAELGAVGLFGGEYAEGGADMMMEYMGDPGEYDPAPVLQDGAEDLQIEDGKVVWTVPRPWDELRAEDVGHYEVSSYFYAHGVYNLQLAFYPNGKSARKSSAVHDASESPMSTVSFVCVSGAQLKFKMRINGKWTTPKVCLGTSFSLDVAQPVGDDPVVIECEVLENLLFRATKQE
mmetsp:Transcript_16994/g.40940  ORF Transcript_16994/g.40940 Transcript_16994/m.40940 type:complete len:236 (-) Transcript_16994:147-854(-)